MASSSKSKSNVEDFAAATRQLALNVANTKKTFGLAWVVLVVAIIAMVPSALGVAQYTEADCGRTDKEHAIYAVQSTFLALATVAVVASVVMLVLIALDKKKSK
jgi:uncharacterized membrane protein YidH (DUF202 family)